MVRESTALERRHWPSELGLIVALVLTLAPFTWTSAFHGDEFTNLNNGLRVLGGEVIYRDFFELTAPLSHWLAAWTFLLTGPSLLAGRVMQDLAMVASGWLLYRLARRLGVGPWTATLPGLLLVLALYRAWPGYSHHWIAMPFLLGALLAAMHGLESAYRRDWGLAGVLAGLSFLAMQTDGLVVGVALTGVLALNGLLGGHWRATGGQALSMAGGAAVPLGMAIGYLALHGALVPAWEQIFVWPTQHYKPTGSLNDIRYATDFAATLQPVTQLPFWYGRLYHMAALYSLLPTMGAVALAWGLGLLWRRLQTGPSWRPSEAQLAVVALTTIGFLPLLMAGRADYPRVAIYAVPAVLFATAIAARWARRFPGPEMAILRYMPHGALVMLALTGAFLTLRHMQADPEAWLRPHNPDARLAASPVVTYLRERTGPGDRLVAMPNGGFFYFYARPAATRYSLIWPRRYGFTTEAEWQEVWREIERNRPAFIVVGPYGVSEATLPEFLRYPLPTYQRVPQEFTLGKQPIILLRRSSAGSR